MRVLRILARISQFLTCIASLRYWTKRCALCRGRNFVDKFETSSRHDPRRGDRRVQVREGRGRRSACRTSCEQEEEGILESSSDQSFRSEAAGQVNCIAIFRKNGQFRRLDRLRRLPTAFAYSIFLHFANIRQSQKQYQLSMRRRCARRIEAVIRISFACREDISDS